MDYPMPQGVHAVPTHLLDLRPDSDIDLELLKFRPVASEKNVWFYWHGGYEQMHPYTKRNIRAWHQRFSKLGWIIRVVDRKPGSPHNIDRYLDSTDPGIFPQAFIDQTLGGPYALQHTSDLVRWPLLLRYGGVYADVGMMQIGDLDQLWNMTVGDPNSPWEVLSYNAGDVNARDLTNYFLCSRPQNEFFERCHKLLLALWARDGGKTSTEGMHADPLVAAGPVVSGNFTIEEEGKDPIGPEEVGKMLTDYIIQGRAMSCVMGLIDEEDGWHGPRYVAQHVYAMDYMVGSQLINEMTAWNGRKAFDLMSQRMPEPGQGETTEQKEARAVVEACLSRSFGFKLAHGLILRVFRETLGSLWRQHEGSDNIPGTYAHWLRYGIAHWTQDMVPPRLEFQIIEPFRRGRLLSVE